MWLSTLLLTTLPLHGASSAPSLLATVPDDAYVVLHSRDFAGLRSRAERNDWYRLLGSPYGEPWMNELSNGVRQTTRGEMGDLLAIARELPGEVLFFDTEKVAGFVTEAPADRRVLSGLMREWLPQEAGLARRSVTVDDAAVELVAWPELIDGWAGRSGHYAAFVEHPRALALLSGDDDEVVMAAVNQCVAGLSHERRAPVVSAYLEAGGGRGSGLELYVDFTPLVDEAERTLKRTVQGMLPDPTNLLGLEEGTWLHLTADVHPGTRIDTRARLNLPPGSLVARLADSFGPLPTTLPMDLPRETWGLYALNWDLKRFYRTAREAYVEAGLEQELGVVDAGMQAAQGMSGVDPETELLNQLTGVFVLSFLEPPAERTGDGSTREAEELDAAAPGEARPLDEGSSGDDVWDLLTFHAGLVDGPSFLAAFKRLTEVEFMEDVFERVELAGTDAYVFEEGDLDGGLGFLPKAFTIALTRSALERGLLALTHAEGASLLPGSRMQAAIDGNVGACFLAVFEMTPVRRFLMPELEGELLLPPLEPDGPPRDPFDSQLIGTARRTPQGFELSLRTQ